MVSGADKLFHLPDVNEVIQSPNGTPSSGIIPALAIPNATPASKIDASSIKEPPYTETVD